MIAARSLGWAVAMALALIGCTSGPAADGTTQDSEAPTYVSETYASLANWLCHPLLGPGAPCASDGGQLDVTLVAADGTTQIVPHVAAADPPVDCFYVYPTTSLDDTAQADLVAGIEERFVTTEQAARYTAVCRVFAPIYRQVSITGLFAAEGDFDLAYADVLDAFRHYLANDGLDRPFLLLGHSQGTGHLARLIAEEIEPDPELSARMVAAHLLGGFVVTPEGSDVGGTFASTPPCASASQTGCVVHYSAYRADEPPGADAVFAVAPAGSDTVCVDPSALLVPGAVSLGAVFPTEVPAELAALVGAQPGAFADPAATAALTTPYFAVPGLVNGACAATDDANYLAVTVAADPADPRADDIGGDLLPGWGLHLVDPNLAQLDLVGLAAEEIAAYLAGS